MKCHFYRPLWNGLFEAYRPTQWGQSVFFFRSFPSSLQTSSYSIQISKSCAFSSETSMMQFVCCSPPPPSTSAESGWIAWCTLCVAVSGRRKTRQPTAAHRIAERSDWHRFPTRRLSIAALNRGVSQSHFLFLTNRPMSSISFISRPSDVSRTPSAPPTDRLDQANSQFCVVEKSGSVATTTSTATIDGYLSLSGIPLYYINEAEELYLPGAHLHHQTDCHSFLSRSMVISVPDSLLCYADCFLGRQPD